MKNILTLILFVVSTSVFSIDIQMSDLSILNNDKEGKIKAFSEEEVARISDKFGDESFRHQLGNVFYRSLYDFMSQSKVRCEFNFKENFRASLHHEGIAIGDNDISDYLKLLRVSHYIDDILYDSLNGMHQNEIALRTIDYQYSKGNLRDIRKRISRKEMKLEKKNNVSDLYVNFQSWPDEEELCVYRQFNFLRDSVKDEQGKRYELSRKDRLKILERLNSLAYKKGLIDLATLNKLQYLSNDKFYKNRYITLQSYFDVVFNAKNKLLPHGEEMKFDNLIATEKSDYAAGYVNRRNKLTRRKDLYEKYSASEIMMLAQVLVKASRRMGVDPEVTSSAPVITQTFEFINPEGERENYVERLVLDPQSQYNLARKRMRKDIFDLQTMDIFYKKKIRYSEIVMAAFETGYITYEDIEYVVKYDDLWNPERTRFEKIKNFIFDVAGYATFFAPPPFNAIATLGLTLVEGVIDSKNVKGENNENISTFID